MKCFAWTSFLHHREAAKPGAVKFRRTYMDHITLYHPGVMLASCFYHASPCIAIVSPCIMLLSCFTLYRHCITLHHRGVMLATPLSSFFYHYCITLDDMRGTAKPVKIKFRRTWITLYHPGVMLASCLYNLYHLDASIFLVTPCIRLVSPYIILV